VEEIVIYCRVGNKDQVNESETEETEETEVK
jgi:hypothetical protein